ncbi:MAG: GumC family protein [Syntrophobacteraceae bacterium]
MESSNDLDIVKLTGIIKRRKWWLILPLLGTILTTALVCVLLPNTFMSQATILIHNQQIPSTLVPSTITSFAQERIQSISQEVTSRSKLLSLVEKYSLVPDKKKKLTTEELVDYLRKRIALRNINAEINPERGGQPIQMTIAFSLSYEDESPKTSQAITNDLASFFLEKNAEARNKHARGTTEFLQEQLKLEKERIDQLQTKLAEFQNEHLEELPEYSALNMQKLEKLNTNISEISMQVRSLEEQRSTLKGNLAMLDPNTGAGKVITPAERLQQAQLELANLRSRCSELHPSVVAKKHECALLETESRGAVAGDEGATERAELEAKLTALRSKYSEKHPEVQATLRAIEKVKRESEAASSRPRKGQARGGASATNPAYVNLQAELDRIGVSISSLKAEKTRFEKQIAEVYKKLHAMPQVAKGFMALDTELQIARTHYNEIQQKLLAARVAQGMEEEQLGESFEVIEPAFLPEKPYKPNRLAIMLIGIVLGVGFSVGTAALKEISDRSVRDASGLEALTSFRVISVIPRIITREDLARKRRRRVVATATSLGCFVGAVLVFHFLVMDLDVFYAKVERVVMKKIP